MFKISEKTELNQISLTGIRALIFMGLLITKPCSLEEIRKTLIDLKKLYKNKLKSEFTIECEQLGIEHRTTKPKHP